MGLSFRLSQRVCDKCPWNLYHRHHDTSLYLGFWWLVGRQHIHARAVSQIHAIQPIRQIVPIPIARLTGMWELRSSGSHRVAMGLADLGSRLGCRLSLWVRTVPV